MANHLHAIYLYSVDSGQSTQVTSEMGDSREPAFDREGKYLYFITSTNEGATSDGLDMTSDLYQVTSNIYALTLAADTGIADCAGAGGREGARRRRRRRGKKSDDKGSDAKEATGDEKASCEARAEAGEGGPGRN